MSGSRWACHWELGDWFGSGSITRWWWGHSSIPLSMLVGPDFHQGTMWWASQEAGAVVQLRLRRPEVKGQVSHPLGWAPASANPHG